MMNLKATDMFKTAPLGLKLIILIYSVMATLDAIYLIEDFSVGRVLTLFLALATTSGFLFRWEAIRGVIRFLIGFFFTLAIYKFLESEKFRAVAVENALFGSITSLVPIAMFFYLGRRDVKAIFKSNNVDHPTTSLDADG